MTIFRRALWVELSSPWFALRKLCSASAGGGSHPQGEHREGLIWEGWLLVSTSGGKVESCVDSMVQGIRREIPVLLGKGNSIDPMLPVSEIGVSER